MAKIIGWYVYPVVCPKCARLIEFEKTEIEVKEVQLGFNEFEDEETARCPYCRCKIDMKGVKPVLRKE